MSETLEIPANTGEIKESEKQERSDTSSTNLEQQSQQEISSLTQETKDKLGKLTQEIITKIDQDPDFYKKDNAFLITIGEKLKNKEYFQAFFALLQGLIKGFSLSSKSGFKHLESELQKLNLPEKSLDELQELIGQFEKEIKNQNGSLSDLTDKTFLLSQCKDKAMEKHCAEKHLAEPTPYDKLRYHIFTPTENAVGKVLLFNVGANGKGESGFGTSIKKSLFHPLTQSSSGSGFQHAVMISKIDNDGTVHIVHANAKGVIEETLTEYFSRDNTMIDVMMLTPPASYGEAAVNFAKSKRGAQYDTMGMAFDAISGSRKAGEKSSVNMLENKAELFYCSELIFEGFQSAGLNADTSLFSPGDLMKLLTPTYCTSFDCKHLQTNIQVSDYPNIKN